jgi:hypothetical protein
MLLRDGTISEKRMFMKIICAAVGVMLSLFVFGLVLSSTNNPARAAAFTRSLEAYNL